jgi:hypothetical protein
VAEISGFIGWGIFVFIIVFFVLFAWWMSKQKGR